MNDIKNVTNVTRNEDGGMLSPTTEELTGGKFNRYQLAYGAARGARMITNEYVRQRTIAEKLQAVQKDAGGKEAEKPLAAMVDPEYRDQKAVRLAITKLSSGEFVLVEREGEIADIDAEAAKALAAELAMISKHNAADHDEEDWDEAPAASEKEEEEITVSGYTALMDALARSSAEDDSEDDGKDAEDEE